MQNQEIHYLIRKLGSQELEGVTMVETNLGAYAVRKLDIPLTGPKVKHANNWGELFRAKEAILFHILLLKSPEYISRDALINAIWGYDDPVITDYRNLSVRAYDVRLKLEKHKIPYKIKYSQSQGYRLLPIKIEEDEVG